MGWFFSVVHQYKVILLIFSGFFLAKSGELFDVYKSIEEIKKRVHDNDT